MSSLKIQNVHTENPFPGLRAFRKSESHLFFGREENIAEVIAKLDSNHFVAIVGTSGTGKSSLIRAGVLPQIEGSSTNEGGCNWRVVSMTPGNAPIENLAQAISEHPSLADAAGDLKSGLTELMHGSSLGLVQGMRPFLKKNDRLLLLIDQFEEVFRFAEENESSRAAYDQFVKLIIETVRQRDIPIYAILTLRSDFLGDCVAFEGLPEAINDGHYLVPRMTAAQMKRAITGPIDLARGKISPRLVQHITTDLGANQDQLPILQHAMMRCWDYWKMNELSGEPMDIRHFEAIGDLEKALSSHADEAYHKLSSSQKLLTEKIFKCLTTKQSDNRGVRRPMSLAHLARVTQGSQDEVLECLRPFREPGCNFILPGLDSRSDADTIFDISHESLMRGWSRLAAWVNEEMESAEFFERICTAADLYQKGASALWRDPELQLALDWQEKQKPIKAWAELYDEDLDKALDFIITSQMAAVEEKRKKTRRVRGIRFAVASFMVVISILAAWAMFQTNIANQKSGEAQVKSEEALAQKTEAEKAREEAQAASEEADMNRQLAQQQAEIAEDQARQAEEQKRIAEQQRGLAVASELEAVNKQQLADRKSREAILQKQKADSARYEALRLRYLATGQNLAFESSQITGDPELSALLTLASYQFASTNGGNLNEGRLYGSAGQALAQLDQSYTPVLRHHPEEVIALCAEANQLGFIDFGGNCIITRPNSSESDVVIADLPRSGDINTAYLDLASGSIALGLDDNTLQISTLDQPGRTKILEGHSGLIRAVGFRNEEPHLVTGGRDGKLIVWKNTIKKEVVELPSRVKAIAVLDNSEMVLAGCENGSSYFVNVTTGTHRLFNSRPGVRVEALTASAQGDMIALGYSDGITQLMATDGTDMREVPGTGSIVDLVIDSRHKILVVATSGKKVTVYDLAYMNAQPREIPLDRPIREISLDRAAGDIYVYCSDHSIRRYPTSASWYIEELRSRVNRKLTPDEWITYVGQDIPYHSFDPQLATLNAEAQ